MVEICLKKSILHFLLYEGNVEMKDLSKIKVTLIFQLNSLKLIVQKTSLIAVVYIFKKKNPKKYILKHAKNDSNGKPHCWSTLPHSMLHRAYTGDSQKILYFVTFY